MNASHYAIEQLAALLAHANQRIEDLQHALTEAHERIAELEAQ